MNTKSIGRAYAVICDIAATYYSKPLFYMPELMADLKKAGNTEYKADKEFPVRLYGALSNALIVVFLTEFENVPEKLFKPCLLDAWRFHKKCLLTDMTEAAMGSMVEEAGKAIENAGQKISKDFLKRIYFAVLQDVAARAERSGTLAGEGSKELKTLDAK